MKRERETVRERERESERGRERETEKERQREIEYVSIIMYILFLPCKDFKVSCYTPV